MNPYDDAAYAKGYDESLELRRERDSFRDALYTARRELDVSKKLQLEYLDQAVQRGKQLVQADDTIETLRGLLGEMEVHLENLPYSGWEGEWRIRVEKALEGKS